MRFWDASALVPLVVQQSATGAVNALRASDPAAVVWWGTVVECVSAIARLERMGELGAPGAKSAHAALERLAQSWIEVEPSETIRSTARDLLSRHELTAADAFQLAAALHAPPGDELLEFVCLDQRLRRGALKQGFTVLPALAAEAVVREPAALYHLAKYPRSGRRATRGGR